MRYDASASATKARPHFGVAGRTPAIDAVNPGNSADFSCGMVIPPVTSMVGVAPRRGGMLAHPVDSAASVTSVIICRVRIQPPIRVIPCKVAETVAVPIGGGLVMTKVNAPVIAVPDVCDCHRFREIALPNAVPPPVKLSVPVELIVPETVT
jgi:hypothetical protein